MDWDFVYLMIVVITLGVGAVLLAVWVDGGWGVVKADIDAAAAAAAAARAAADAWRLEQPQIFHVEYPDMDWFLWPVLLWFLTPLGPAVSGAICGVYGSFTGNNAVEVLFALGITLYIGIPICSYYALRDIMATKLTKAQYVQREHERGVKDGYKWVAHRVGSDEGAELCKNEFYTKR